MMRKVAVVITGIILLAGCYYDKEDVLYPDAANCGSFNTSFAAAVHPIIQSRCAIPDCHADGSINGPGPLTSYERIKNAAVRIKTAVVTGFMPQNSSLNKSEIKTISCWVDAGAPNN